MSMIQSVVANSMQSGFNSVVVSCSAMSEVSSRGGKWGRRQSKLNGGILTSKAVQTKEWWNTDLEAIGPYSLGDGV